MPLLDNTAKWGVRKLSNFKESNGLTVGFEYLSINTNIPAGSIPLSGGLYSRTAYPDLWTWVQGQPGYLLTEDEWQTKSIENAGTVPYYSYGDGSTTFRVPSLKCWINGSNGIEKVGTWFVKAYGTVTNIGSTDLFDLSQGVTDLYTRVNVLEKLKGSGAAFHNSICRGRYLGDHVTDEQWAAIKNGTFDDLYLLDYWTINGVDYVIMAFDYYMNCGDTATTAHHIVIVPRTVLYNAQMNTSNVTTGGYVGSAMYTSNLASAKTTIANAFGSNHILTIRQLFVNTVANGYSSNGTWTDATVWLMNEINVYGSKIFGDCIQGTNWAYLYTIDNAQYPAFMFDPSLIKTRQTYWLRDVAGSAYFADVGYGGDCSYHGASSSFGVRPAFCIYQS